MFYKYNKSFTASGKIDNYFIQIRSLTRERFYKSKSVEFFVEYYVSGPYTTFKTRIRVYMDERCIYMILTLS